MRRSTSLGLAVALLGALAAPLVFSVEESAAELENQVFTSRPDRLRMVVPRGWRATDQPSYPGVLLWMMRTQPPGQIVLTAEPFTRSLYCSWPAQCRALATNTARYACALRESLLAMKMRVGPAQLGPKENEASGLPSVWFDYDDGKRYSRQAVAMNNDRAVSLVLSAPTPEARATHVRPFDQALRTLTVLTVAESAAPGVDAGTAAPGDAGVPGDAGPPAIPTVTQSPIGPCPR